jgi:uroporphyrinogen decarboxylase
MTERERFSATMHYRPRDRSPICDFNYWHETIDAWHEQGLPARVQHSYDGSKGTDEFFGLDQFSRGPHANVDLCPAFEQRMIEDRGDHELVQQSDGVTVLRKKHLGSIPQHHGHLLVDRASWNKHYKPRLDPSHPDRMPKGLAAAVAYWSDATRPTVATLSGGSLFGRLRDWMGLENVALVPYDDPAWFGEMVETLADCIVGTLERVFATGGTSATGGRFDGCGMWEDMCFASGPLLSPAHFKQFLVPQYRRITDLLRKHGVDVVWLDCDGKIDALIPLWLESGVNCMFPVEVGTWNADPVALRREYGKDLLMMGGFDKRILMRTPAEIEAEVHRLAPLVEEGGYIGFCDHRVPPDVPLGNYMHYLRLVRHVWGKDVNLKPLGYWIEPQRHGDTENCRFKI